MKKSLVETSLMLICFWLIPSICHFSMVMTIPAKDDLTDSDNPNLLNSTSFVSYSSPEINSDRFKDWFSSLYQSLSNWYQGQQSNDLSHSHSFPYSNNQADSFLSDNKRKKSAEKSGHLNVLQIADLHLPLDSQLIRSMVLPPNETCTSPMTSTSMATSTSTVIDKKSKEEKKSSEATTTTAKTSSKTIKPLSTKSTSSATVTSTATAVSPTVTKSEREHTDKLKEKLSTKKTSKKESAKTSSVSTTISETAKSTTSKKSSEPALTSSVAGKKEENITSSTTSTDFKIPKDSIFPTTVWMAHYERQSKRRSDYLKAYNIDESAKAAKPQSPKNESIKSSNFFKNTKESLGKAKESVENMFKNLTSRKNDTQKSVSEKSSSTSPDIATVYSSSMTSLMPTDSATKALNTSSPVSVESSTKTEVPTSSANISRHLLKNKQNSTVISSSSPSTTSKTAASVSRMNFSISSTSQAPGVSSGLVLSNTSTSTMTTMNGTEKGKGKKILPALNDSTITSSMLSSTSSKEIPSVPSTSNVSITTELGNTTVGFALITSSLPSSSISIGKKINCTTFLPRECESSFIDLSVHQLSDVERDRVVDLLISVNRNRSLSSFDRSRLHDDDGRYFAYRNKMDDSIPIYECKNVSVPIMIDLKSEKVQPLIKPSKDRELKDKDIDMTYSDRNYPMWVNDYIDLQNESFRRSEERENRRKARRELNRLRKKYIDMKNLSNERSNVSLDKDAGSDW